jgi:hypothetical protein
VPVVERLLPGLCGHRRNYLAPGSPLSRDPQGAADAPGRPDFDLVTELWYDGVDVPDPAACADRDMADRLARSEARLFDSTRTSAFPCDEFVTPADLLQPWMPGHPARPAVKLMGMIRRKAGMSRDAFIERYEGGHCRLALGLLVKDGMPSFAEYRRSFPRGGEPMPFFDVLTQVGFWTEADFLHFQAQRSSEEVDAAISEDEAQLFDRSSIVMFQVEERISIPVTR